MRCLGLAVIAKGYQYKRLAQFRWQACDLSLHDFKGLSCLQIFTWIGRSVCYPQFYITAAIKLKKLPDPAFAQNITAFIDCNAGQPWIDRPRLIETGELEPSRSQCLLNGIFRIGTVAHEPERDVVEPGGLLDHNSIEGRFAAFCSLCDEHNIRNLRGRL